MREPTIRKQNIHRNNLKIRLNFFWNTGVGTGDRIVF